MSLIDLAVNNGTLDTISAPGYMQELSGFEFTHGNFMTRWIHQAGYECVYFSYVYAMCWSAHITKAEPDKIKEYLQYSSADNLQRMFGPLDVNKFVATL